MSVNYDKYRAMPDEKLQREIDAGHVTLDYLRWLGVVGNGRTLREAIK